MIYQPREDSYLLRKYVEEYASGRVLDMGTGSGIQARAAVEVADTVVAVDIDPESVEHVSERLPDATVQRSDLFQNVTGTFDTIIFNPPYLPNDSFNDHTIHGGTEGHEVITEFLQLAPAYLAEDGTVVFLISDKTGVDRVEEKLDEQYEWRRVGEKRIGFETLYVYTASA